MNLILAIVFLYILQMILMFVYHAVKETRNPESVSDFLTLTCLPIVLYKKLTNKNL